MIFLHSDVAFYIGSTVFPATFVCIKISSGAKSRNYIYVHTIKENITTVCLFSNETKDDDMTPTQIEIIKFRKKFLKEYALAIVCTKF